MPRRSRTMPAVPLRHRGGYENEKAPALGATAGEVGRARWDPSPMQILRAVADSGLYRIDHFQNRPQKNSKPTEAVRRRFTSRREAEGFNIKMAVFLGHVGEARQGCFAGVRANGLPLPVIG